MISHVREEDKEQLVKARARQNQRIIKLIKSKLLPLSKSQVRIFPSLKSKSLYTESQSPPASIERSRKKEIVLEFQEYYQMKDIHPIVEKARKYLNEEKSKQKTIISEKQIKPYADVSKYLDLFQEKKSRLNEQLLNLKKQSEEKENKPFYLTESQDKKEGEQMSEEEASLLNARIRQRLNHRKLIALYRN